ncbi:hypothetical protein [Ralstonia sp. SET104]|uniref:hypothetical protein n=1 Tax=Ralstonia sp. SET104 TaxID=2448774 RepID=UPI000FF96FF9|nr:hypothetical protein [Ralstonia sp. SET104]GCB06012.1 hypothetical protein PSUB009319_36430 [Ralstonia sp. SET104]
MTRLSDPQPLDPQRLEAHGELFDKLSKLRAMLGMLHSNGLEHFRELDAPRQAEYLWTCMEYANEAYAAMLVSDGMN